MPQSGSTRRALPIPRGEVQRIHAFGSLVVVALRVEGADGLRLIGPARDETLWLPATPDWFAASEDRIAIANGKSVCWSDREGEAWSAFEMAFTERFVHGFSVAGPGIVTLEWQVRDGYRVVGRSLDGAAAEQTFGWDIGTTQTRMLAADEGCVVFQGERHGLVATRRLSYDGAELGTYDGTRHQSAARFEGGTVIGSRAGFGLRVEAHHDDGASIELPLGVPPTERPHAEVGARGSRAWAFLHGAEPDREQPTGASTEEVTCIGFELREGREWVETLRLQAPRRKVAIGDQVVAVYSAEEEMLTVYDWGHETGE